MKVGIDKIGFYTPGYMLDMISLANARKVDPDKFTIGIGQDEMSVAPIWEDCVTMAANAAEQILSNADKKAINLVIIGTESSVDQSKAAGLFVAELLGLPHDVRTIELKEACYGATAGLMLAKDHISTNPTKKALVIGSDIARYGLNTPGEVTQGAGAVAMLISTEPRILAINSVTSVHSESVMDFWRPNYSRQAFADGKLSNETYIRFFAHTWQDFKQKTKFNLSDFAAICFHLPYTKMGLKALRPILGEANGRQQELLLANYQLSTFYSRQVGNIYTGSLYLSLLSLLEQHEKFTDNQLIGLFSYGSGAIGEFFTGQIQAGYQDQLMNQRHTQMLSERIHLLIKDYEALFNQQLPSDGSTLDIPVEKTGQHYLSKIEAHQRQYK